MTEPLYDPVRDRWQCQDCGGWYPREELNALGYCRTCTELDEINEAAERCRELDDRDH